MEQKQKDRKEQKSLEKRWPIQFILEPRHQEIVKSEITWNHSAIL